MEVTDVKIYPVGEDKLQAFVSVVLDHCFRITDIKIIQGSNGRFLSMPSKKRKDGSYRDIAHPLNSETRSYLEQVIFRHYDQEQVGAESGEDTEESRSETGSHATEDSDSVQGLAAGPAEASSMMT